MKNKISRILSSLLIVSFLISVLAVFASAEANTETEDQGRDSEYFQVFYNRDFEEGWDYKNGFATEVKGTNTIKVDYEEDYLRNYNYFVRYEANSTNTECYTRFDFSNDAVSQPTKLSVKGTVIEFSVKADDLANLGTIFWMSTAVASSQVQLLRVDGNGNLEAFPGLFENPVIIDKLGNDWINIAFAFDWTKDDMTCTLHTGYGLGKGYQKSETYSSKYSSSADVGIGKLFFGFGKSRSATGDASIGMSVCFDNIKIYHGTTSIIALEEDEYGERINTNLEKVIDIKENANVKSKAQIIEEALALKVGVNYALARNERCPLIGNSQNATYNGKYGAPVKQGDDILVSLQLILDYIGFPFYEHPDNQSFDITTGTSKTYITLGRNSATVDGNRVELSAAPGYHKNSEGANYLVISLNDVPVLFPGWLALYDEMGLVIIYQDSTPDNLLDNEPLVNRKDDLDTMVNTMKKFVYDFTDDVTNKATFAANGVKVYNDVKTNTNNFQHPYLIANAETFTALNAAYASNAAYKAYVDSLLAEAEAIYNENANSNPDGSYHSLKEGKAPVNPYADGKSLDTSYEDDRNKEDTVDGYDTHGRLSILVDFAEVLPTLGFAYQMTGNNKYVYMAYAWAKTLAEWTHWGPGYMQDCAEATSAFAIGYDWLYNAYVSFGLDTTVLADAIFNLGVHDGYIASTGAPCQHARSLGDMSVYNTATDSKNAVATSGMVIGSLAILDYITGESLDAAYYDETLYLLGNNLATLFVYGLDMYAPEGAYIESALNWEKATSNFMRMNMALISATGSDYGFMSTWGIDKTCDFAIAIESSDGFVWNYHDGGSDGVTSGALATLNTDMFNFVAGYFGDSDLYATRAEQISRGKAVSVYDIIFYPLNGMPEKSEVKLDYFTEGVEAFISRSDFTPGSMYTGLMGGANNAVNGQIDSGNFIYHNKGLVWAMDLGTENPNIADYGLEASRYKYYRASGEGQNVLLVTSDTANIAYGQHSQGSGILMNTFSNEFGSYATIDNKSSYSGKVTYANRGVLVTNNRETVVLQDEFVFQKVESVAWVLHTPAQITLDNTGRVAYLKQNDANGNEVTVRLTLVSLRPDFVFTESDASSNLLTSTLTGTTGEYDRTGINKLVIESTTLSFDIAVVFEVVDDIGSEEPVKYTWTQMANWMPVESPDVVETTKTRGEAVKEDIKDASRLAERILDDKDAFTKNLNDLYSALTLVTYTLKTYAVESLGAAYTSDYTKYTDSVDDYEEFMDFVNETHDSTQSLVDSLMGFKSESGE